MAFLESPGAAAELHSFKISLGGFSWWLWFSLCVSVWYWSPSLPQVEFCVCEVKRTGLQTAVSVRMLGRNYSSKRLLGYVAALKDNFGFIETANHDKEIFFHYRWMTVLLFDCVPVLGGTGGCGVLLGSVLNPFELYTRTENIYIYMLRYLQFNLSSLVDWFRLFC